MSHLTSTNSRMARKDVEERTLEVGGRSLTDALKVPVWGGGESSTISNVVRGDLDITRS